MRRIVDARSNTPKYLKVNVEGYSLSSELRISNISFGGNYSSYCREVFCVSGNEVRVVF